jgi:hypothetical protein
LCWLDYESGYSKELNYKEFFTTSHQALMMGAKIAPETSIAFNHLTRLIAREGFCNFSSRESFRSYIVIT